MSDAKPEESCVLLHHEFGTVVAWAATNGLSIRQERQGSRRFVEIEATWQSRGDAKNVAFRVRWNRKPSAGSKDFPVRILPDHLPEPIGEHSPYRYAVERWPSPDPMISAPRIDIARELLTNAGYVLDGEGSVLMAALPARADLESPRWYADSRVILVGAGWGSVSEEHRVGLQERISEIHEFLAEEFGRGDRVRAFVLCETGALRQKRAIGQVVALNDTQLIGDRRWYIAERHVVEQMACMWWTHGVHIGGYDGAHIALGFALYAVVRWFETSGKREHLDSELAFWRKVLRDIDEKGGRDVSPAIWLSIHIALELHAHTGAALQEELRNWCETDWGCSLHETEVARRLARLGIELPRL